MRTNVLLAVIGASLAALLASIAIPWWSRVDRSLDTLMRTTFRLDYWSIQGGSIEASIRKGVGSFEFQMGHHNRSQPC